MRLPNGYGSVFKLSGVRRRPYIARKTVGYTDSGKQIYSVIGYFETKEEALTALANYNQQDIPEPSITLAKVYQLWYPIHARQVSSSTATSYKNSYNHLAKISAMPIAKIKYRHLQEVLDTMRSKGLSYASLKKVRSLIIKYKTKYIPVGDEYNLKNVVTFRNHNFDTEYQTTYLYVSSDTSYALGIITIGF